jgi:hypothetical protein
MNDEQAKTSETKTPAELERIKQAIADDFDEELEMQMEDDRLDELVAEGMSGPADDAIDRKVYFRELFRLQHELVKLQDWVQYKKLKMLVIFESSRGGIRPARAAPSSASRSASIRAPAGWWRYLPPPTRNRASGISSVTCRICRRPVKWCCSTVAGTTAPGSSG